MVAFFYQNFCCNSLLKIKDTQFCVKNLKMKRKKRTKFFDLLEREFESQFFSNFPAHDLNFHGS